jgi:predicted ATP-grasp superfamily ATP-dependent carboligase
VNPAGFAAAVQRAALDHGPTVVYPGREESLEALLAARDGLPPEAVFPYPATAVVQQVRDKRALPDLAGEAGLTTPDRLMEATVAEVAAAHVPTPCVVKPLRKGAALHSAQALYDDAQLRALLDSLPDQEVIVVQRHHPGRLSALSVVVDREGALAARFQQEARRTWPADAGPSSLAVSVAPDAELAERVRRMLAGAGYWGLAQVQFIAAPDGARLIDVNPRFYGSLSLALAAGVNLPAVWHSVATGGRPTEPAPYEVGVTYRWLEAELFAVLHGSPRLLLERAQAPRTGPMWARDDPGPSFLLGAGAAAAWISRQASRASGRLGQD